MGWLCRDCNTGQSRHIRSHLHEVVLYNERHECHVPLFDVETSTPRHRHSPPVHTKRNYLSNGGGDGRYVMVAEDASMWTAEQLAVALGVNANTARCYMNGRYAAIGENRDGTWLTPIVAALAFIRSRQEIRT